MNAHGVGEVALAGATSNLFAMLADSYRRSKRIQPGDEIIILDSSHEVRCFTASTSGSVLFRLQGACQANMPIAVLTACTVNNAHPSCSCLM